MAVRQRHTDENGVERWFDEKFEIIQLLPANGAKAVLHDPSNENADKSSGLIAIELHFIGLTNATETEWMRGKGEKKPTAIEISKRQAIVGIVIEEGYLHITNEFTNYCGIQMPGQDIADCTGDQIPV